MPERNMMERVEALRENRWHEKRVKSLSRFPQARRYELGKVLNRKDRPMSFTQRLPEAIAHVAAFFDAVDARQRSRLWEGLFPTMAGHIERAWSTSHERPYMYGYQRAPFRAPTRPGIVREQRARYFLELCDWLHGLDPDPAWLAAWAPHITPVYMGHHELAWLLATVLNHGGRDADAVRGVLIDSINGEHEIGRMGGHAVVTLLNSRERSDWEVIGRLLIAAQRQEGLRQSILESVDEANPNAFRYMLGLILEHDLGRFSSVVRAFDVWFGFHWAGGSVKTVQTGVRKVCEYFDDPDARRSAIDSAEPEDAYLALWTAAYSDADTALAQAERLLSDPDAERRYAALNIISRIRLLPEFITLPADRLISGEEDDDRMLMAICSHYSSLRYETQDLPIPEDLFEAGARLFERVPAKKSKLKPIVWPWAEFTREKRAVASALFVLSSGDPAKLLPYADALDAYGCANVIRRLVGVDWRWDPRTGAWVPRKRRTPTAAERAFIVRMMADRRGDVHGAAFEALKKSPVTPDEVEILAANLHRTSATFRRGAIERLLKLPAKESFKVGEELLASGNAKKQAAGLEILQSLAGRRAWKKKAEALVAQHRESLAPEADLAKVADRLAGAGLPEYTLDDCLGLAPEGSRAAPFQPRKLGVAIETKAAQACIESLAACFLEHAETEIEREARFSEPEDRGQRTHIGAYFPSPLLVGDDAATGLEEQLSRLPIRNVWQAWVRDRRPSMRDKDGLELYRAWALLEAKEVAVHKTLPAPFRARGAWELKWAFAHLVAWLPLLDPRPDALAYFVDRVEHALATWKPKSDVVERYPKGESRTSRQEREIGIAVKFLRYAPLMGTDDARPLVARLAALEMLAADMRIPGCGMGPDIERFGDAFAEGLLNEHDLARLLVGRMSCDGDDGSDWRPLTIQEATSIKRPKALTDHAPLSAMADRVRDRIVEVELTRGERASPVSHVTTHIRHAGGASTMLRLASALGKDKFVRQHQYGEPTRAYSLSHLISVTMPTDSDSDERFKELATEHKVRTSRLLEIAMYAPQWAGHVERLTGAAQLEDAVWWIHAHTKRSDDWRNQEIREVWSASIAERTEIDADDLEEGAVDVGWFQRLIGAIGEETWTGYLKPAKYASNSGGHKRAQLFADAMLGRVSAEELLTRISEKRHQDSVRALGLVPLAGASAKKKRETLQRYSRLQEFRRESRKFGSQRQASEGRAVDIGMQNLARTAGYRDPSRLQWAMEAEAVADLANGPVTVTVEETSVSLSIDESGAPRLDVLKDGKTLKNVPAKHRKHDRIVELRSRVTDLRRQGSRMRRSLEEAMCRGDSFSADELAEFFAHPMLRPMIERLVLVASHESPESLIGYPVDGGRALRDPTGALEPVGRKDAVRLAHPSDLLGRGDWHEWQRECFEAERMQPFKQVFREMYPLTEAEAGGAAEARRYAGHQVNPRQALSLLKTRQWVFAPEEGVRRVYHDEGLVAELWFQQHFHTPAEVDGLTLESVRFRPKGEPLGSVALREVPVRVFSETMRDLDLVVSVAHAGGVDPEASASTIEMRSALLRETCRLLGLDNVRVEGRHALIDGKRARYSVHLGSASTRVLPGTMLVIVAVHSQYRGRLFLPFADDDPRTAEVVAKTLLLARDEEIKDPRILDQICG